LQNKRSVLKIKSDQQTNRSDFSTWKTNNRSKNVHLVQWEHPFEKCASNTAVHFGRRNQMC